MSSLSRLIFITVFLLILVGIVFSISGKSRTNPATQNQAQNQIQVPQATPAVLGTRTKTSGCTVNGPFPDRACTPGAIFPEVTAQDVCTPGYSKNVRNVTTRTKNDVYNEYGITSHKPGEYEVDHVISLELGGSNSIANLWPEAALPVPGFHQKDQVENYLHDQVCSGKMNLQEAQQKIATDWLSVYNSIPK